MGNICLCISKLATATERRNMVLQRDTVRFQHRIGQLKTTVNKLKLQTITNLLIHI